MTPTSATPASPPDRRVPERSLAAGYHAQQRAQGPKRDEEIRRVVRAVAEHQRYPPGVRPSVTPTPTTIERQIRRLGRSPHLAG